MTIRREKGASSLTDISFFASWDPPSFSLTLPLTRLDLLFLSTITYQLKKQCNREQIINTLRQRGTDGKFRYLRNEMRTLYVKLN